MISPYEEDDYSSDLKDSKFTFDIIEDNLA